MRLLSEKVVASPVVKWVGGKRQLQSRIIPILKSAPLDVDYTYFEPFMGGGAIYFSLQPQRAVLGDINKGLVNLYRVICVSEKEFKAACALLETKYNQLGPEKQSFFYYQIREKYNAQPREGLEAAVNFIFLNKTCFNGMYRENRSGSFNVPYGNRKNISLLEESNLSSVSEMLKKAEIINGSYLETTSSASEGDLVYFDPPYIPISETASFTSYTSDGFDHFAQVQLRNTVTKLSKKGVYIAMSNSSSPLVHDLYQGFNFHELSAARNISATNTGRKSVLELLITNF